MNEARPYASLSSGLLARKGSAKPAMRPQAYGSLEDLGWNDMGHAPGEASQPAQPPEHVPSSITALTPAPKITRTSPGGGEGFDEGFEGASADEYETAEPIEESEAGFEAPDQVEAEQFEAEPVESAPVEAEALEPQSYEAPPVVTQQRAILERFDGEEEPETPVPATPKRDVRADVVPLPQRREANDGHKAAFTLRLDSDRHLRLRLACAVTGRSAQQIVARALEEALAGIPEIEALATQLPAQGRASAKRN